MKWINAARCVVVLAILLFVGGNLVLAFRIQSTAGFQLGVDHAAQCAAGLKSDAERAEFLKIVERHRETYLERQLDDVFPVD